MIGRRPGPPGRAPEHPGVGANPPSCSVPLPPNPSPKARAKALCVPLPQFLLLTGLSQPRRATHRTEILTKQQRSFQRRRPSEPPSPYLSPGLRDVPAPFLSRPGLPGRLQTARNKGICQTRSHWKSIHPVAPIPTRCQHRPPLCHQKATTHFVGPTYKRCIA